MNKLVFYILLFLTLSSCEDEIYDFPIEEISEMDIPVTVEDTNMDSLLAWYPFNNNTEDESGNELHGYNEDAGFTSCRDDNPFSSLEFIVESSLNWGAPNERVIIPYNESFNTTEISISSWVMLSEKPSPYQGRNNTIVSRWHNNDGVGDEYFAFYIDDKDNLQFTTKYQTLIFEDYIVPEDEWVHIVVTINESQLRFYVNGGFVYQEDLNSEFLLPINDEDIYFGEVKMYNGYWYHFNGKLDDIGIWGKSLSPCEVLEIYNNI